MAITLKQEPDFISLGFQPEFYLCDSTYATEIGFKYVFIIENKDGQVLNKKVWPFPDYYGRIDISNTLYNYLDTTLLFDTTGNTHTQDTLIQYKVSIGHTGSTNTYSPTSQGVKYLLHGADLDFGYEDYIFSTPGDKYFLTHQPLTTEVNLTDYYTLTGLVGSFGYAKNSYWHRTFIDVYYSDGSERNFSMLCDGYNYNPNITTSSDVDTMCQTTGVGPVNLNNSILYDIDNSLYITGETIIHTGTTSYRVWIGGNSATRYSQYYTFNLNHIDNKYTLEQICFLNRLGNYSYFTFRGKTRVHLPKENDSFIKNRYGYDSDYNWVTDSSKRGKTIYNANVNTEVTFVSDYIDQDWFDFMEELYTSPDVYWIKDGKAISMNVIDNDWEVKRKENDKLINFSIKCELANEKYINI